jgi:hypothetical protein
MDGIQRQHQLTLAEEVLRDQLEQPEVLSWLG